MSAWIVRRTCRIVAPLTMLLVLANTLPMLWAMADADHAAIEQLCHGTQGCTRAYLCPSSMGTIAGWNHPAVCLEGPFTDQEVDGTAWSPWVLQALPSQSRFVMPNIVTVHWSIGEQ